MIINHNMASLNTYNKLSANNAQTSKALEKLSSGLRINRAGDDAAGLAISEKMRGQIRGLDQASRNAQDATSMLNTAEGNLAETQSILQRMKELATQAANDTNVGVDRSEIQKEINQLTSEINRIGNTTEFNTQKLLKGDGKTNLDASSILNLAGNLVNGADVVKTQAKAVTTFATDVSTIAANDTLIASVNGINLTVNFKAQSVAYAAGEAYGATATSVNINGIGSVGGAYTATNGKSTASADVAKAFQSMIDANDTLRGNYTAVANTNTGAVTIEAVKDGAFDGLAGQTGAFTGTLVGTEATATSTANGTTTNAIAASKTIDLSAATGANITTDAAIKALVGKGFTVNGTQVEFYNANDGAYTGEAVGVNVSDAIAAAANKDQVLAKTIADQLGSKIDGVVFTAATANLVVTAAEAGKAGNNIALVDGGVQEQFKATFQVGANTAQSMTIEINDMRSKALNVSGTTAGGSVTATNGTVATFKSIREVTDGTSNTTVEYALDVSDHNKATAAISVLSDAIETVSAERSKIGAYTNRLEHTVTNLTTSSENMTAAESRIRDVDMAKEMMNFQKNNILSQAAQAMLAQANQQPQGVLQLLR
ncbi:MAG: flagellin [Anaeromusa sp.]|uniref:flagellin N-terminal helical domain-containing protein n=1 Tax=Anaeromusa sp. TaxID=1872520 RepID=UPI002B2038FC|nr:flagellin [Anaeromusa sp.]MEA4835988.1 flagellin [Anaeromusa sp.]